MLQLKIFVGRFLSVIFVFYAWGVDQVDLVSHRSHLCEAMDMPCQRGNGDECRMKYYRLNSTNCRDLHFSDVTKPVENNLGKVQLESYHYNLKSYKQTGFNLTFTDIRWNHLKFRFKQEGNEMKNTCREFKMYVNSTVKNLFYDCLWSNENYEGKTFSFEYEARNDESVLYKKYSFRVPFAKNIDRMTNLSNWEIFMFVETFKNAFGLTTFVLHWQPLPERFSTDSYHLMVFSNESGLDQVVYLTNVTCKGVDDCKYHYNKWYGNVQFGIQPVCKDDLKCFISKSAVFLLGGKSTKPLLIGIVSVTVIVPAMIYVLYLLRSYLVRKSKSWMCSVPEVLIIYTPSLATHVSVVFALVEYLREHCNVKPMLDELDIFMSKSRDPFKWCNEAFKSADVVVVVASPCHKHLRLASSVYQNTDTLLLRLLKQNLSSRDNKSRFFVLMLPYCSEKDIPSEAINLRRFAFPEDLNKMLKFMHRNVNRSLPDCLTPEIQGGKETYKLFGQKLRSLIAETQTSLKKNKSEYEFTVEETRLEKKGDSEQSLLKQEKEKVFGYKSGKKKAAMMELAENMFGEFPGRLDDLNLSGEERVSLMESQNTSDGCDVINLDTLEL